jgi:hypothetical protein
VATVVFLGLMIYATTGVSQEQEESSVQHRATGEFEVDLKPEDQDESSGIGRMSLSKSFSGGFEGTSTGSMLASYGDPKTSAAYVAIERLEGHLDGLFGSFVLVHKGVMTAEQQTTSITIAPDTGTGELKGITGSCTITIQEGLHSYEIHFSLPEE